MQTIELDEAGRSIGLAVIGLGRRSVSQLELLLGMRDVRVLALCDELPERLESSLQLVREAHREAPLATMSYREALEVPGVEAAILMTGWENHIELALEAVRRGVRPGLEVGGANSVDECWRLVRASEDSGVPVMLLENCCYGRTELALLRMVREGVFGTLAHCEGGYEHDLREQIGWGDVNHHYRQQHFAARNAELYPTHELGPMAKYVGLNDGNRVLSLCSMASASHGMGEWLRRERPDRAGMRFAQGDIVTTMLRCAGGETLLLTHDCTLPRPYSRGGRVQGTRGLWLEDAHAICIEGHSPVDAEGMHQWEPEAPWLARYEHPLWAAFEAYGTRGGHGGMDYLTLRAFIESVQQQTEPPIDVYDTALWMSVTCLSEQSIALGGAPVDVPDFTGGRWMNPRRRSADGRFAL